jgi:ATP-binding cassette subfamily G (WHITE) protein 2 (SNQ2)
MYHLSPFTYLIEALLGQGAISISSQIFQAAEPTQLFSAVGGQLISCSDKELVSLQPPAGESCVSFMAQYISRVGGYLTNSVATADCRFCSSRTTDEWMGPSFNIFYRHHWRDFGIFCAYILFNVRRLSLRFVCCYSKLFL